MKRIVSNPNRNKKVPNSVLTYDVLLVNFWYDPIRLVYFTYYHIHRTHINWVPTLAIVNTRPKINLLGSIFENNPDNRYKPTGSHIPNLKGSKHDTCSPKLNPGSAMQNFYMNDWWRSLRHSFARNWVFNRLIRFLFFNP